MNCEFCRGSEVTHEETCPLWSLLADLEHDERVRRAAQFYADEFGLPVTLFSTHSVEVFEPSVESWPEVIGY